MAALPVNQLTAAGIVDPALVAAAAGGDTVAAFADRTWIEVNNASGGSINVTVADPGVTPAGNPATSQVVAVGAGVKKRIWLPAGVINSTTGLVSITYSAVASVTAGAFRI
jgi:hypothetical protein